MAFGVLLLVVQLMVLSDASAATIYVTKNDGYTPGNGSCSLTEAIKNANLNNDSSAYDCVGGSGTDRLLLIPDTSSGTFSYSDAFDPTNDNAVPTITDDLIIDGDPWNMGIQTTIERVNAALPFRLLDVTADLTLQSVRLTGGKTPALSNPPYPWEQSGGALRASNAGELKIVNSTLDRNEADWFGSAVYANNISTFSIANSVVEQNFAKRADGPALYVNAYNNIRIAETAVENNENSLLVGHAAKMIGNNVTVVDSSFRRNGGGGLSILSDHSSIVDVSRSEFSNNVSRSIGNGNAGLSIEVYGNSYNVVAVTHSTIANNIGRIGPKAGGLSIFIHPQSFLGPIRIVTVAYNTIVGNVGGNNNYGAGLSIKDAANVRLYGTLISGNEAAPYSSGPDEVNLDFGWADGPVNVSLKRLLIGHSSITTLDAVGSFGVPAGTASIVATSDGTPYPLWDIVDSLQGQYDPPMPGTTYVAPLPPLSPAINAAGNCHPSKGWFVVTDQLHKPRDKQCDIGAYEAEFSVIDVIGF